MKKQALTKTLLLALLIAAVASVFFVDSAVTASAYAPENTWETMRPMRKARQELGAAVVGGKIYAIGGVDFAGSNEMYDPATNSWSSKQPMPTPRRNFGIAACNNKIYCIGGSLVDGRGPVASNEAYDPATNSWANLTAIPTPRRSLQANAVDGKIYLIGGELVGATDLNEVYDVATDTWTTKEPMPTAVYYYASAVVNGKIYILGGIGPNANSDTVQIYDPATDSWSMGATPTVGLRSPWAAATTGVYAPARIYMLGGADIFSASENVVYDPATDSWRTGASMPTARASLGVAVVDDILYAIGGSGNSYLDPPVAVNEKYTPIGYGTVPTTVQIVSPEHNGVYSSGNVSLAYVVNKPSVVANYSLDGQEQMPLTGSTTLTNLTAGVHTIQVYAIDSFGNQGNSERVTFTVIQPSTATPTTTLIIVAAIAVTSVSVFSGALAYFKKRKKQAQRPESTPPLNLLQFSLIRDYVATRLQSKYFVSKPPQMYQHF